MKFVIIFLLILSGNIGWSQKKALDTASYKLWRRVDAPNISEDGKWVTYHFVHIDSKYDTLPRVTYLYNPEKNIKLATYASRCIENEILMYLRRSSKMKAEVSIDEPLNVDWDGNELLLSDILGTDDDIIYRGLEDETERQLLKSAIDRLSPREKTIVELRYGLKNAEDEEMTQKEVADRLGISQSYISRLEKKIMKRLKKEIVRFE